MKKTFIIFLLLTFCLVPAFAKDAIYKTTDGTQLKCTATKKSGSIIEFGSKINDTYTFENGKIYSLNMVNIFIHPERRKYWKPRKAGGLKIDDSKITFNEKIHSYPQNTKKKVQIDRKTGKYTVDAIQRFSHIQAYYWKKWEGTGKCTVVK